MAKIICERPRRDINSIGVNGSAVNIMVRITAVKLHCRIIVMLWFAGYSSQASSSRLWVFATVSRTVM